MASRGPERPTQFPSLFLFDIDGTLMKGAGPQHREALEYATSRVLGVRTSTEGIPVHGMLDTDIVAAMLRREGVPLVRIRNAMDELMRIAERRYVRNGPSSLTGKVCPGVRALLARLQHRGVPLLLVTGNFARIGWRKVELAGLRHYFAHGAFAGMSATRAGLARLAIRHARERGWLNGAPANASSVVLIGDAPSDILAAHSNRIRSIAVCTGISTREELEAHRPHLLIGNLGDLRLSDFGAD